VSQINCAFGIGCVRYPDMFDEILKAIRAEREGLIKKMYLEKSDAEQQFHLMLSKLQFD
jgi:hypothetical protein